MSIARASIAKLSVVASIVRSIIAGDGCNAYLFDGTDPDYHEFDTAYSGLLQVIVIAASETGLHADIIAGRQGAFVASTDPLTDMQQNQYEITAVSLTGIVDATFSGRIAYSKDGVEWIYLDMGALPIEVRTLIEFDSVLNGHCVLNTPITFAGDFEAEIELSTTNAVNQILIGDRHDTTYYFSFDTISLNAFIAGNKYSVAWTTQAPHDGKLHKVGYCLIGNQLSFFFDDALLDTKTVIPYVGVNNFLIGTSNSLNTYFGGIIANAKLTDLTNPANNQTYKLDQATGNVEASQEGNHTLTYVNIPESNRELFESSDIGWDNISPMPQELPAQIEVAE